MSTNKVLKLVRKRIDVDGLTKIPDQVTTRMVQKERAYQQQIENLHEQIRRMQRFVYALININNNQVNQNHSIVDFVSKTNNLLLSILEYSSTNGNNLTK